MMINSSCCELLAMLPPAGTGGAAFSATTSLTDCHALALVYPFLNLPRND